MAAFAIDIVRRPRLVVAGYKIRTSMQDVGVNCRKVWEDQFMPRMAGFPVDPAHATESFGVSLGVDPDHIDYYAAMALKPGSAAPDGMETVTLADGVYCSCRIASMAEVGSAFLYIYNEWIRSQDTYTFDFSAPSYEFYDADFLTSGAFRIYCPISEK